MGAGSRRRGQEGGAIQAVRERERRHLVQAEPLREGDLAAHHVAARELVDELRQRERPVQRVLARPQPRHVAAQQHERVEQHGVPDEPQLLELLTDAGRAGALRHHQRERRILRRAQRQLGGRAPAEVERGRKQAQQQGASQPGSGDQAEGSSASAAASFR